MVVLAFVIYTALWLVVLLFAVNATHAQGYKEALEDANRIHSQKREADLLTKRQATRRSLDEILRLVEKALEENEEWSCNVVHSLPAVSAR